MNALGAIGALFVSVALLGGAAEERRPDTEFKEEAISHFSNEWFWGDSEQQVKHEAMVGREMPTLALGDWYGEELTAEQLENKILIIDFWATWCGPCVSAIPKMNKILQKYAGQGVAVMGVCSSNRGSEKMEATAKEHKMAYPSARDQGTASAEAWNVWWWPTYALVDRNGIVRAVGLRTEKVESALKVLLKEQPGPKSK